MRVKTSPVVEITNYKFTNHLCSARSAHLAKGSGTVAKEPAPCLLPWVLVEARLDTAMPTATRTPSSAAWAMDRSPAVWSSPGTPHYQKCAFCPLGEVPKAQQREQGKKLESLNKVPERMNLYSVSFQIPVSVEQRHLLQHSLHQCLTCRGDGAVHVETEDDQEAEPWPCGSGSRRQHISGVQLISGLGDRRRW